MNIERIQKNHENFKREFPYTVNSALGQLISSIADFIAKEATYQRSCEKKDDSMSVNEFLKKYPFIGRTTLTRHCANNKKFKEIAFRRGETNRWRIREKLAVDFFKNHPRHAKLFKLYQQKLVQSK